eukprot:748082-Hanusia_phi.AAC.2
MAKQKFHAAGEKRGPLDQSLTCVIQLIQYEAKLQKEGVLRGKQPSIALEDWDMWTTGDMQMLRKQVIERKIFLQSISHVTAFDHARIAA